VNSGISTTDEQTAESLTDDVIVLCIYYRLCLKNRNVELIICHCFNGCKLLADNNDEHHCAEIHCIMITSRDDSVRECERVSAAHWSIMSHDVTSCAYDVMSSPWQRDAGEMMTMLKPAVIPTVVESESVFDDDSVWHAHDILQLHQPPPSTAPAAAAAVHRRSTDTDTDCHRPVTVVKQG